MKYLIITLIFAIGSNKPLIEPMIYEDEIYGFVLREGVRHYEENGRTVYYIDVKTVKKISDIKK